MKKNEGLILLVLLYVDDFLITSSSAAGLRSIKSTLNQSFTMTDLGRLRHFIGLKVSQKNLGIMISLYRYTSDMIRIFHMEDCKATPCRFLSGIRIEEGGSIPLVDSTLYKQLIGSLLYLTHLRQYISYVVSVDARYMQEPHELH